MLRFSILPLCFLALCGIQPAHPQETRLQNSHRENSHRENSHRQDSHLAEKGSGPLFARSAFAHGYRHGYEEGYHVGNIDANMGRLARTKKSQLNGLSLSYSSVFGAKKSFEEGFHAGVWAGYSDGFAGRTFRAVDSIRAIAAALDEEESLPGVDSASHSFDRGLASGYGDGLARKEPPEEYSGVLDFRNFGCGQLTPHREKDLSPQDGYCEGYWRGFVLGQGDAVVLRSEQRALEASK